LEVLNVANNNETLFGNLFDNHNYNEWEFFENVIFCRDTFVFAQDYDGEDSHEQKERKKVFSQMISCVNSVHSDLDSDSDSDSDSDLDSEYEFDSVRIKKIESNLSLANNFMKPLHRFFQNNSETLNVLKQKFRSLGDIYSDSDSDYVSDICDSDSGSEEDEYFNNSESESDSESESETNNETLVKKAFMIMNNQRKKLAKFENINNKIKEYFENMDDSSDSDINFSHLRRRRYFTQLKSLFNEITSQFEDYYFFNIIKKKIKTQLFIKKLGLDNAKNLISETKNFFEVHKNMFMDNFDYIENLKQIDVNNSSTMSNIGTKTTMLKIKGFLDVQTNIFFEYDKVFKHLKQKIDKLKEEEKYDAEYTILTNIFEFYKKQKSIIKKQDKLSHEIRDFADKNRRILYSNTEMKNKYSDFTRRAVGFYDDIMKLYRDNYELLRYF
jgi:hypothetical protein